MAISGDFEVWVDAPTVPPPEGRKPAFPVKVFSSPAGPANGELKLDLTDPAFAAELAQVTSIDPDLPVRKAFGARLFDALFAQDVRDAWRASWGRVDAHEFDGLRLRLAINVPALAVLPWELMWDDARGNFLAADSACPVSRYLEVPEPAFLKAPPKIRILVIVESPEGHPTLAPIDAPEVQLLEASLLSLGDVVEYELLKNKTADEIQNALQRDFHVLHYLGHGRSGQLILPDAAGKWRGINDQEFATMLGGRRSLRLIVLNACHSAQAETGGIFAGVGPSLVRKRMPAVIAMQYPSVQLDTAGAFSRAFYRALANGLPVDAAVNEARQLLATRDLGDRDWSTPVLYTGTRSGRILNFENRNDQEVEQLWRSLQDAARRDGTLASLSELSQRFKELTVRVRELRELTTFSNLVKDIRLNLAPVLRSIEGSNGIENVAQFNAVVMAWNQLRLNALQLLQAFTALHPERDEAAQPLFEVAARIDAALGNNSWGTASRDIKELNQSLARVEADAHQRRDDLLMDISAFTDQTIGKLTV